MVLATANFNSDTFAKENTGSSVYKNSNMNGRFEYSHDQMSSQRHRGGYNSPSHPTNVTSSTNNTRRTKQIEQANILNKTDLILL